MSTLDTRWASLMMANYATPQLELTRGAGCVVWDQQGREYLDLVAGIATCSVGHAHPEVVAAISGQAAALIHTSNLYAHEPGLQLAEQLIRLVGLPARLFFCQDGASANEAAIKLTRIAARQVDPTGSKREIVAMHGSFHGRTMGALSVTGSEAKQAPFRPLLPDVSFIPYGDIAAARSAVSARTAAVIVEPVQGEAGVIIPPPDYLGVLRELCDASNALLIVDEVQSGIGRTGDWFASLSQGVTPDIITLAKGLAGGMPLGACIGLGRAGDLFAPGDHGSTFGGNPVSCAAALAVLRVVEEDSLLVNAREVSELLADSLRQLDSDAIAEVRAAGLWIGIDVARPQAKWLANDAQEHGYLINAVSDSTIRLAPALTLTSAQAERFLTYLTGAIERMVNAHE